MFLGAQAEVSMIALDLMMVLFSDHSNWLGSYLSFPVPNKFSPRPYFALSDLAGPGNCLWA